MSDFQNTDQRIAVVGYAGRFAGCEDLEAYWRAIVEGRSLTGLVPPDRWRQDELESVAGTGLEACAFGGFMPGARRPDWEFFGFPADERETADAQHGVLLEVAHEAVEDANVGFHTLTEGVTGVYVGIGNTDFDRRVCNRMDRLEARHGIGTSYSGASNRLSYVLNLTGPSLSVDTACASTLSALHLALQAFQVGEIDFAITGGVHTISRPEKHVTLARARVLSPSGETRTFCADADGYVRAEGCGVLVLARLDWARRMGLRPRAVLLSSSQRHSGLSNGLTAPSGVGQRRAILGALSSARLDGRQVGALEAHGTGTILGDQMEVAAAAQALRADPGAAPPLHVSTSKTVVGHAEAAGGAASLLKAVLMVERGVLPPARRGSPLSDRLSAMSDLVSMPTQAQAWDIPAGQRICGVNAFSFGGANAHVIVGGCEGGGQTDRAPRRSVISLSGQSPFAVDELLRRYLEAFSEQPRLAPQDVSRTLFSARKHLPFRRAFVLENVQDTAALENAFGAPFLAEQLFGRPEARPTRFTVEAEPAVLGRLTWPEAAAGGNAPGGDDDDRREGAQTAAPQVAALADWFRARGLPFDSDAPSPAVSAGDRGPVVLLKPTGPTRRHVRAARLVIGSDLVVESESARVVLGPCVDLLQIALQACAVFYEVGLEHRWQDFATAADAELARMPTYPFGHAMLATADLEPVWERAS